jgi:hypothetical protein
MKGFGILQTGTIQNLKEIKIWSLKINSLLTKKMFQGLTRFDRNFGHFCMNDSEQNEAKKHFLAQNALFSV